MRTSVPFLLLACVASLCTSSCAVYRLGPAPTDTDLANDGSIEEQERLYQEYQLTYQDGFFVRPGATPIKEPGITIERKALPEHEETANYLASSHFAMQIFEETGLSVHRATKDGMLYLITDSALIGVGALSGALAGVAMSGGNPALMGSNAANCGLLGGIGGCLAAAAVDGTLFYVVSRLLAVGAATRYPKVAEAYNSDLRDRIKEKASQPASPANSPTVPPDGSPNNGSTVPPPDAPITGQQAPAE